MKKLFFLVFFFLTNLTAKVEFVNMSPAPILVTKYNYSAIPPYAVEQEMIYPLRSHKFDNPVKDKENYEAFILQEPSQELVQAIAIKIGRTPEQVTEDFQSAIKAVEKLTEADRWGIIQSQDWNDVFTKWDLKNQLIIYNGPDLMIIRKD